MRTPILPLVLLFLMIVPAACKPLHNQDVATLNDVNAGQRTSTSDSLMDDPAIRNKKMVLIYYVNDTYGASTDDPAYQNLQHILRSLRAGKQSPNVTDGQKQRLEQRAQRYQDDWDNFRRVSTTDINYLTQELCKQSSRFDAGLVVFQNFGNDSYFDPSDSERQVNYKYCKEGGQQNVGTMRLPILPFPFASQPFAHPYVFKKAIEQVMMHFPTGVYRYALITKSHGSRSTAIAPFIGRDVRTLPDKDIWQAALASMAPASTQLEGKEDTPILDGNKEDTPILDGNKEDTPILDGNKEDTPILDGNKEDTPILDGNKEDLPILDAPDDQPEGVSKESYLSTLYSYGGGNPKLGAYFPIVFMEACKSDLALSKGSWIEDQLMVSKGSYAGLEMENIGLLYTADEKGLRYQTIDFKALFGPQYTKYRDLQDALKAYLDGQIKK